MSSRKSKKSAPKEISLGEESERLAFVVSCSFEQLQSDVAALREFYNASGYARFSATELDAFGAVLNGVRGCVARTARNATVKLGGV